MGTSRGDVNERLPLHDLLKSISYIEMLHKMFYFNMCNLSKMCNICGFVLLKDSDSQDPLIEEDHLGIPPDSKANGYEDVDELNAEAQPEAENTLNPEAEGEEQTEGGEEEKEEAAEGEEETAAEEGEEGMSAEGESEYEPTAEAEGIEFSSLFFVLFPLLRGIWLKVIFLLMLDLSMIGLFSIIFNPDTGFWGLFYPGEKYRLTTLKPV